MLQHGAMLRWFMKFTVIVSCFRPCFNQRYGDRCDQSRTTITTSPDDCSVYFRCVNKKWRDYKCPAGEVFNPVSGMCTWPKFVPGCNTPTSDTSQMTLVEDDCVYPCPEDGRPFLYPKWKQCNKFYLCKDRKLYIGKCTDLKPKGTYRYFNFFMFSCDRFLESNNVCWRG